MSNDLQFDQLLMLSAKSKAKNRVETSQIALLYDSNEF